MGTEEEKLDNPGRKSTIGYDFGKGQPRFEVPLNNDFTEILQKDQLILDPEPVKPKIKGNVRFVEDTKKPGPIKIEAGPNTEMRID